NTVSRNEMMQVVVLQITSPGFDVGKGHEHAACVHRDGPRPRPDGLSKSIAPVKRGELVANCHGPEHKNIDLESCEGYPKPLGRNGGGASRWASPGTAGREPGPLIWADL